MAREPGHDVTITLNWVDAHAIVTANMDDDTPVDIVNATTAGILDDIEGRVDNLIDELLGDDVDMHIDAHIP